ncbi:hypothetical protein PC9H_004220 [Pleurotus ostreatus]|uniref:FAD-binding PCMH-type domain-containing protein n=1 Tax=Pleurotus ostreatus TaxID=5322 RepID=A0A8H7A3S5_PLEOS|nr:uncharacterized protein PC9H_004220 [Pleurotus ostreatus]KAF7437381.1 hypothetical protein PC9H_004220 [Pleurotus ostreatus]KAJ8703296.1 hypothetical protein PTI98_001931 [Pleurotus ostreatus]
MGFLHSSIRAQVLSFLVVANAASTWGASSLISCLQSAGINTVSPNTSGFTQDALAFNRRFEYTPAAIVFPQSAQDVAAAVKCAAASNGTVPVAARSGGHSYGAFGLGGQDGALVVDLSQMKNIVVNSDETATFQTGNRLGDVALALFNNGGRALAHGTCPYVGSGGHAGCGGFGLASRMWGLVLDQVESAEVVLADGSIVQASASTNSDLFWAIRGASPSFGIVTEYKVKTHAAPASNIIFSYSYSVNPATATKIFTAFQTFSQSSAPPELGLQASIGQSGQKNVISITLTGVYYGSTSAFNKVIAPLLSAVGVSPQSKSVKTYAWVPSLVELGGINTLNTSLSGDSHDTFFAKSLMVHEDALLTTTAIRGFFDYIGNQGASTDTSWFVLADLFGGKGSKVRAVSNDDTAYSQRKGLYNFQMYASSSNSQPPFPADGLDFVNNMLTSITSKMPSNWSFGAYACYTDPTLTPAQWKSQYYGDNYSRLVSIHSKYNPSSLFRYPQSIGS